MNQDLSSKKVDTDREPDTEIESLKLDIRKIAHDLSNPLGTLRMAVYYLENVQPDKDKQGEYFTMMSNNIDRLEGMIRRLRVLAGSPSVDKEDPPDVTR
jgi:nitrogen-specific signal transduction histidine kinase